MTDDPLLTGLLWAKFMAAHMADCQGVEKSLDTPDYRLGFLEGIGACVKVIDAKIDDVMKHDEREIKHHDARNQTRLDPDKPF